MSWWRRLTRRRGPGEATAPEVPDHPVDREDPAVALALKVLAEEGDTVDDALIARALEVAKADYDAAPDEEKPEKMRKVAQLSVQKALAKAQREKFRS
ncbi:hypothetical protein [Pseudooceanicola sp. MF1-13]|uniref:hypothetical protein n=1 Tax=Pseudooceanicola sp. MF1-13 TaxID=3379095 RepID=UPI0038922C07